jgi:hypothetical protein
MYRQTFSTDQSDAPAPINFPDGHGVIEGIYDHLRKRVDIATGELVDYQPPQPSTDHEWNAETKRWQLNAAAQGKIDAHADALGRIAALEAQGIRSMRELALGQPGAQDRLAAIDAQIAGLRTAAK